MPLTRKIFSFPFLLINVVSLGIIPSPLHVSSKDLSAGVMYIYLPETEVYFKSINVKANKKTWGISRPILYTVDDIKLAQKLHGAY